MQKFFLRFFFCNYCVPIFSCFILFLFFHILVIHAHSTAILCLIIFKDFYHIYSSIGLMSLSKFLLSYFFLRVLLYLFFILSVTVTPLMFFRCFNSSTRISIALIETQNSLPYVNTSLYIAQNAVRVNVLDIFVFLFTNLLSRM